MEEILAKLLTSSEREFYNYLKTQEIQETQIYKQMSETIALTELVKAKREVLELMSSKFFEERRRLEKIALNSLDMAIENGELELANIALELINNIYEGKYLYKNITFNWGEEYG